jgi:hypothetical protein
VSDMDVTGALYLDDKAKEWVYDFSFIEEP